MSLGGCKMHLIIHMVEFNKEGLAFIHISISALHGRNDSPP